MDTTQISIKINQTTNPGNGKTKNNAQSNAPANSFEQILAMINSVRQSVNVNGKSGTATLANGSSTQGDSKTDTGKLSLEDWKKLDAILTSLILAMQQSPQSMVPLHTQPGNQSQGSFLDLSANQPQGAALLLPHQTIDQSHGMDTILQALSGMLSTINVANSPLANFQEQGDGGSQGASVGPNQLMNGLAQLLGEVSSQEKQNPSNLLNDIGGKIQQLMNELNTKTGEVPTFNSQVSNASNITTTPQLSLDKNQVIFSSFTKDSTQKNLASSKPTNIPAAVRTESPLNLNGMPASPANLTQVQGGWSDLQTDQSAPSITVSEFSPEVSDLIGRYLKITNGQSGSTEAKFSLYPEHLGPVEVKIVSQQGQVSAQILTNTPMAKEALEGQLQHLKDALLQQGVAVQKLDIVQQPPAPTGSNQTNLSFFQNGSNSSNDQRNYPAPEKLAKKSNDDTQNDLDKEIVPVVYGAAAPKTASKIDFIA